MAKTAGTITLNEAFKEPSKQKETDKEEVKCDDFGIVLLQWKSQVSKGSTISGGKFQPHSYSKYTAPNTTAGAGSIPKSTIITKPAGIESKNNASEFWNKMKKGKQPALTVS